MPLGQEILLRSARHLEERLKVSQSVSRQASSESVGQAGREKHTVKLFSVGGRGAQLQNKGNQGSYEQSAVQWQHTR